MNYSKENIKKNSHYFALMLPSRLLADSSERNWAECEIIEERYKIDDGYKVTLNPLNNEYIPFDFYQDDFISLMEAGMIIEKTGTIHIEHKKFYLPLTDTVYIVFEGDCITD